ncbi:transcriptional regulator [Clostridia bacterium]|nr:transcriptional regulator [Clostridia bacterium]
MNDSEQILILLDESKGYITAAQVTEAGIQRRTLGELVAAKRIYRAARGIYALPEAWEDEMFFLQYRYSKGVFSNETALYLHGLSDRTPGVYTMTFPHGYGAGHLKNSGITAKFVKPEIYELGVTELPSPCGNPLRVYDKERTLCDIVKGQNGCDIQLVNQAMKVYAGSNSKDMAKLIDCAEKLQVKAKILRYMEVLL